MQPQEVIVAKVLTERQGEVVHARDLIAALYPNPDDEPDDAHSVVRQRVHTLRHLHYMHIETVSGYRLTRRNPCA